MKHPYISDLKIELYKDDTLVRALWNNEGDDRDDIAQLIPVSELKDKAVNGKYTLKVVDGARQDEGKLVRWGIVAEVAAP